MTTPYKLSLFDKTPVPEGASGSEALANSLGFALEAERLGYHRVWLGEHHGAAGLAGVAPEVLAAWLLAHTTRIRIGSGGVLLQHYSPFKIAEQFRLLASLAPGRVDLGIGKAPGGLPLTTRALQVDHGSDAQDLAQKLADLDVFLGDGPAEGHPLQGARALPEPPERPQTFLLGASEGSARLAADLDWQFAFAGHFDGGDEAIERAQAVYRGRTGRSLSLSASVVIAQTDAEARAEADKITIYRVHLPDGRNVNLPDEDAAREFARQAGASEYRLERRNPRILAGTAAMIRAEFDRLSAAFGISEFFVDLPVADPALRLAAIRALAKPHAALAAAE
jgi:luciferase family oxidoreductase group 1